VLTLPNGTSVTSGSREVDRVLSAYFQRDVTLARAAPDDFTIDQSAFRPAHTLGQRVPRCPNGG
jgi:hypothetical protein